jgi:hypothetical protein
MRSLLMCRMRVGWTDAALAQDVVISPLIAWCHPISPCSLIACSRIGWRCIGAVSIGRSGFSDGFVVHWDMPRTKYAIAGWAVFEPRAFCRVMWCLYREGRCAGHVRK